MAYWTGEERDTISWDGILKAKNFKGDISLCTGAPLGTETDPTWNAQSGAFVPYTGATTDIDLGSNNFDTTGYISGAFFWGDGSNLSNLPAGSEVDPIFNAVSAAIHTSLALVDPHIADSTIHYINTGFLTDGSVYAVSGALLDGTVYAVSGALLDGSVYSVSGALLDGSVYAVSGAILAEVDPLFDGASAAIYASLALVDPHIADGTIHFTSNAIHASLALVDPHIADGTIHFTSNGLWASMNIINTEYQGTSGAYIAHAADSTSPHGATLTQTYLTLTSGAVTADLTTSGAALVRNFLIGTEASTALTASNYTQGTVYLKYT